MESYIKSWQWLYRWIQILGVRQYFENNQIPLTSVIACATYCAPSMIGRYRGFIELLKAANPHLLRIQLIIHGQQLRAKNMSGRLNLFLKTVIKAMNKIKAHAHAYLNNCAMRMMKRLSAYCYTPK